MIDPKQEPLLGDRLLPLDVPPSYDTLDSASDFHRHQKSADSVTPPSSTEPSSSSSTASKTHPVTPDPGTLTSTTTPTIDKAPSFWSKFFMKKTTIAHSTILNLVRDIVKQQPPTPSASDILDSCLDACNAYNTSFSSLLQQKSIENHTPFTTIPLHPLDTIHHIRIRHACLLMSDQALFQWFKLCPSYSPLSGTDEMILGTRISPDTINVGYVGENSKGGFVMNFKILAFQKRMRVGNKVELEFIARSRMWRLAFGVDWSSSKWAVTLSILKHSPETWVDSHLILDEVSPRCSITPTTPTTASSSLRINAATIPNSNAQSASGQHTQNPAKPTGKPINIRLRTTHSELTTWSSIEALLEESSAGSSLQYDGCSYLDAGGTLKGRLKAQLVKS
ncbi:hypothetical protein PILCRDRAFT_17120 [Piloderma croceum F 1598]|uniref:Uncharacterized protein n=1 Tax=Piloderma croceum (strain F 1598) TaxID=765440 RepID=A0A0C3EU68_PILCF|nr:hypothetical protein PILCRDRAFT_17120 [Piloderma croceum F 1598]